MSRLYLGYCAIPLHHGKKIGFSSAFFNVSIDYLFDNLECGKRNNCLGKTFGKSLWIQECVRALYIVS